MQCGVANDPAQAPFSGPNSEPRVVVTTKLFPPSLRSHYLVRPDLIALIDRSPKCRLIVICAPAGYGKSTLTAQWLSQLPTSRVWVTLDANDDDLRSFIFLFVNALRAIDPEFGAATEKLLLSIELLSPDLIFRQLIADLSAIPQEF